MKNVSENTEGKNKPERMTKEAAIIKHSIQQLKKMSQRVDFLQLMPVQITFK